VVDATSGRSARRQARKGFCRIYFALGDWEIDAGILLKYFNPDWYLVKLTPLHKTRAVNLKDLMPVGDWTTYAPYAGIENSLKRAGYDVIVFIASKEEDESKITCGNAILSNLNL